MNFHIVTLFKNTFDSYLDESILKRAREKKLVRISFYDPKDFSEIKGGIKKRIDGKPYGGGPGMVMDADPLIKVLSKIEKQIKKKVGAKVRIIYFTPATKQFDNKLAREYQKKYTDLILVCGRYEGIDERVKKIFKGVDISIGPYILTGGELPAMIIIDAVSRQIKGVLGNSLSLEDDRVASSKVYTRPEVINYNSKKYKVPTVLLTGHHKNIEDWRKNHTKHQVNNDEEKSLN